ncbi:hypothetical protein ACIQH6_11805 [Micromonospora orduensis]|uniref:hypothetical protein n=1 Tax=Micromonospora orduensis TaxID=1420891 RepID=UPI0033CA9946
MKVFISWSKPVSHALGLALRDWLPEVIQAIQPWISSEDIDKGQRWSAEVGSKLDELSQGVLCVTPENQREPWLNFEAGALARSLDGSRVRPVLFGLQPADVTGPLAQFQATVASDRDDMLRLLASLNAACAAPLDSTRLERAFDRTWPDYVERLSHLPSAAPAGDEPQRSEADMVGEILERVREVQRSLESSRDAAPARPYPGPTGEVRLGDANMAVSGMRVITPDGVLGRIGSIAPNPTYEAPNEGVATVHFDDGRPQQRFRASILRRPTPYEFRADVIPPDLDVAEG